MKIWHDGVPPRQMKWGKCRGCHRSRRVDEGYIVNHHVDGKLCWGSRKRPFYSRWDVDAARISLLAALEEMGK